MKGEEEDDMDGDDDDIEVERTRVREREGERKGALLIDCLMLLRLPCLAAFV